MFVKSSDGPVNERDSANARTTFFDRHRLGFDSRGDLIDLIETEDGTAEMMLIPIDGFPELPLEVFFFF